MASIIGSGSIRDELFWFASSFNIFKICVVLLGSPGVTYTKFISQLGFSCVMAELATMNITLSLPSPCVQILIQDKMTCRPVSLTSTFLMTLYRDFEFRG